MTSAQRERLTKALGRWLATCTVMGGFMYYHPIIPVGPALAAAAVTCALVVWIALRSEPQ